MSDSGPETWRWLALPLGGAVALLVLQVIGPYVPAPPLVAYGFSFAVVCGFVLESARLCPALKPRALRWLSVPLACLGVVAITSSGAPWQAALVLASLLVAGTLLGNTVGSAIEQAWHLSFVAIVSSLADAVSVLHPSGPSAAIVQSETALSLLALPFAFLGTAETPPLLGVGDVVFSALYVAAARRHGLSSRKTLIALSLAFAVTMVTVVAFELPVPALPFLGLAMVIVHPEARRRPK